MDGLPELEDAKRLAEFEIMTTLTKQHDTKMIKRCNYIKSIFPHIALSTGTGDKDFERINEILKKIKKKSIKNNIDPKITLRIWKSIIWSYVDYQKRNFDNK